MTRPPDLAEVHDQPITTLADLTRLWRAMMGLGGFGRRRLWVVFPEPDGMVSKVVMPIDDIPVHPGAEVKGLRQVLEELGMPPVALLLSRPGRSAERDSDRRWASALASLTPWPLHLATADEVDPDGPSAVRVIGG